MKVWIILLAAILVGTNLYWAGRMLDVGVSVAAADAELDDTRIAADTAVALGNLNLIGLPEIEARLQIARALPNRPLQDTMDGCIMIDGLCVQVDASGLVVAIKR